MKKKNLELYVHIPFCVKKCAYCDFLSGPADGEKIHAYVNALSREIRACGEKYRDCRICTVFFGGGTPSVLSGEDTARIFRALREAFDISNDAEITLEVNPGTVTEEKTAVWRQCGVNRLSIGLQSADDTELKILGRIHTFRDFLSTWELVRRVGFDNINIDLISAVPGQTVQSWENTLRTAAQLGAEHISAYSLIIEEGTPFYKWFVERERALSPASGACGEKMKILPPLPDEEAERSMYRMTSSILQEYGYHRYEISNYAKKGYECRHNLGYWERKEYLGLGLGAASLIGERRFHNTADMKKYLNLYGEKSVYSGTDGETGRGTDPVRDRPLPGAAAEDLEVLSREDRMEEFMFLGLRKTAGIDEKIFMAVFGEKLDSVYGEQLRKLERQGLIECSGKNVRLTERGTDISNYVFSEFIF